MFFFWGGGLGGSIICSLQNQQQRDRGLFVLHPRHQESIINSIKTVDNEEKQLHNITIY